MYGEWRVDRVRLLSTLSAGQQLARVRLAQVRGTNQPGCTMYIYVEASVYGIHAC